MNIRPSTALVIAMACYLRQKYGSPLKAMLLFSAVTSNI
ncbi:hypothetical protein DSUL_20517 [Desulfovibrionales bacterium]